MTLCVFTGAQCCCQPQEGTACPDIPRYSWHQDGVMQGPVPEGEWVKWSDVQRVILDPLVRSAAIENRTGDAENGKA